MTNQPVIPTPGHLSSPLDPSTLPFSSTHLVSIAPGALVTIVILHRLPFTHRWVRAYLWAVRDAGGYWEKDATQMYSEKAVYRIDKNNLSITSVQKFEEGEFPKGFSDQSPYFSV